MESPARLWRNEGSRAETRSDPHRGRQDGQPPVCTQLELREALLSGVSKCTAAGGDKRAEPCTVRLFSPKDNPCGITLIFIRVSYPAVMPSSPWSCLLSL